MLKQRAQAVRLREAIKQRGWRLYDAFRRFDANDDGTLSLAEVWGALTKLKIDATPADVVEFVRAISDEGFIRYDQFYELLYPKAEEGDELVVEVAADRGVRSRAASARAGWSAPSGAALRPPRAPTWMAARPARARQRQRQRRTERRPSRPASRGKRAPSCPVAKSELRIQFAATLSVSRRRSRPRSTRRRRTCSSSLLFAPRRPGGADFLWLDRAGARLRVGQPEAPRQLHLLRLHPGQAETQQGAPLRMDVREMSGGASKWRFVAQGRAAACSVPCALRRLDALYCCSHRSRATGAAATSTNTRSRCSSASASLRVRSMT